MARNIVTSLDVGSSAIKLVVAETTRADASPRILLTLERHTRGLRHGYIVVFDDVVHAIRELAAEAQKKLGTKIKRVQLGLGGVTLASSLAEGSTAIARADQEVSDLDIRRAIEASEASLKDASNRQVIHSIPVLFKLDGKKVLGRAVGMRGNQLEVRTLFVTALTQHLDDLVQAVKAAGLDVEDITAAPLATSFVTLTKVQKMAGCVLVNIGAQTVSVAVFEEGIPMSIAVFSIGSNDVTNDIALGLQVPLEEAEEIKTGRKQYMGQRKKLDEVVEARIEEMFEQVGAHLKKIGRAGLLPAGIIITGGGALLPRIEEIAKETLGLPARRVTEIPALFAIPSGPNKDETRKQLLSALWAVPYGLAILGETTNAEESIGIRKIVKETRKNFLYWLKQLMP
jgi:cell division protein FtsA